MRCHSMPGRALTCPSGWLADELQRSRHRGTQHQETLRATSSLSASLHDGSWGELSGTLRPNSCAVERIPGGGRTQGARTMRPLTEGSMSYGEYNPAKHGWHDPRGQMEHTRLCDPPAGRSWAWTMRKARDHIGYGDDGMVNWGDTQGTAISGDGPSWFLGTKTVPGPFSTKTVPVRRCPYVHIEGKDMRIRGKTFQQGDNMNILETIYATNAVPDKPKRQRPHQPMKQINFAEQTSLIHGGCQTKEKPMPLSRHIVREGRTQRF